MPSCRLDKRGYDAVVFGAKMRSRPDDDRIVIIFIVLHSSDTLNTVMHLFVFIQFCNSLTTTAAEKKLEKMFECKADVFSGLTSCVYVARSDRVVIMP